MNLKILTNKEPKYINGAGVLIIDLKNTVDSYI